MTYVERLRKCSTEILQREIHCQKKQIEIAQRDLATMERVLAERLAEAPVQICDLVDADDRA